MKRGLLTVLSFAAGGIIGAVAVNNLMEKTIDKKDQKINKFKGYYSLLNQWFVLKQEGKTLEQYFMNNGYKTVAIYGMGEMGLRLYEDMKDSKEVEVKYAIDQDAALYAGIEILGLEDSLPEVDVIVVTATFAFDEIKESLSRIINCAVVSLDDVVYEI